ncbi:MAG: glutamate-5-semialdehyde dehydrogenase [Bacteroidaceae bacterium]|nr:glutamate-5-semialdehyde dehydrogenase [Bacteroidaceae bacterium]
MIQQQLQQAKDASLDLQGYSQQQVNDLLLTLADAIMANKDSLLSANQQDLDRMEQSNPLYDRLKLTESRLEGIASDMRNVVKLPSPLGKTLSETTLPNGLEIKRVSVPFGVIGIVYEARPNVTFDVFSLCLKSGNVCVLKGGKDADSSNRAIVSLIKAELERQGLNPHVIELLPATHEATGEMLQARNFIDVVIPRGSSRLINFVRETASVPVIETGAGVCHAYIDRDADLKKAIPVIVNAKTRRVSVCNALDCMIIDQNRLADLTQICQPLFEKGVEILADNESYSVLSASQLGTTYASLLKPATEETFGTEFLAMRMAIKTVDGVEAAIRHIRQYGSGHSECIVTENQTAADEFLRKVDAACVYHNAPTSFTDGAQFGLGAEIGISTQKLHARGPMALEAMTTYKWIVKGEGQVRG